MFCSTCCAVSMMMIPAQAQSIDYLKEGRVPESKDYYMNEYEGLLNQINELGNKVLTRSTFSTQEDVDTYNYLLEQKDNFVDYIYEQKNLSVDELKELKYTDTQIEAIKSYDGSEEKTLRASATVTGNLRITGHRYYPTDNRTYTEVDFYGWWNGSPFFKGQDVIGIGIRGTQNYFQYSSSNSIRHADGSYVNNTNRTYHSGVGVSYKFGIANSSGAIFDTFSMTYEAVCVGESPIVDYGAAYAHFYQSIGTSVGLSISSTGPSAGISFTLTNTGSLEYRNVLTRYSYI